MIIYNYSYTTHKAYPIETDNAPQDAITEAPQPDENQGYEPDGNGGWTYVPDYTRTRVYDTRTGATMTMRWGEDIPEHATLKEPVTEFDQFDGEEWVYNKEKHIEHIRQQRAARYKAESDPLKIEAEFDALQAGGTEPDYSEWIAAVEKIKTELPYPQG